MPIHYLTIIPDKELDKDKMKKILKSPFSLKETNRSCPLNDDLVLYIRNFLLWIESIGPQVSKGLLPRLPYYADSIIDVSNVAKLKNIFIGWKQLFELAPSKIKVLDYYVAEKPEDCIEYLDKNQFVTELEDAINLLDEAQKSGKYVVYEGI